MGRQVITTVDRVAGSCPEIPIVHFAEGDIFQDAGGKIFQTDRTFLFQVNPEKPDVPLNKNDAFQKVQKRRVQEKR